MWNVGFLELMGNFYDKTNTEVNYLLVLSRAVEIKD